VVGAICVVVVWVTTLGAKVKTKDAPIAATATKTTKAATFALEAPARFK